MTNEKEGGDTVTLSKSTVYLLVIGLLAVLLVASIFTRGFGIMPADKTGDNTKTNTNTNTNQNANQNNLAGNNQGGKLQQAASTAVDQFKQYAVSLGLDTAKFDSSLDSDSPLNEINKDFSDGQVAGVQGTPSFFIGKRDGNAQMVVGAQPYSAFKSAIDDILNGKSTAAEDPRLNVKALMDTDDPKIGRDTAPVVIVEFSDFQCPFCERFFTQSFGKIKSDYIDTGKVQFVYRDFPLSFHPHAEKAAVAAECAFQQGKWEEFHNLLFQKQNDWVNLG